MKNDKKYDFICDLLFCLMPIFLAINSAYVVNYKPKVGSYHIYLCTIFGILLVLFSVWAIVNCVIILRKKERKNPVIILLILTILLSILGTTSTFPYFEDCFEGSKTITTNSYLVVNDKLYFLDENNNEVSLAIPTEKAKEFRSNENYEYDSVNNLLKYYNPITVTYYPNSGTIVELSLRQHRIYRYQANRI